MRIGRSVQTVIQFVLNYSVIRHKKRDGSCRIAAWFMPNCKRLNINNLCNHSPCINIQRPS